MYYQAYSILDTKTGIHTPPMFFHHPAIAYRTVVASMNGTDLGRYPADYVLLRVGEYDDQTGRMMAAAPENLGTVAAIAAMFPEAPRPASNVEQN